MIITNFLLFQTAWFVTIFSAANGKPYIGVLFTVLWVFFHLYVVASKIKNELVLIAAAAIIACLFEFALVLNGFIAYPQQAVLVTPAPIWMITLWINLAITINYSMSWLKGRYFISAIFAAVAGPLAYAAGEKIGAIILNDMFSFIAVSIMCLFAMPLLIWISHLLTNFKLVSGQLIESKME